MGMPTTIAGEVYKRLDRIAKLVQEVEAIPNFGPDLWSMKEGDKKCVQIRQDAEWVRQQVNKYIGSGDG